MLPDGAEGPAALSLIYAFISLVCSCTLIWLAWAHNARLSYISCVASFTFISTAISIVQQILLIGWYQDGVIARFETKLANPDSPEYHFAIGSSGIDLLLFYIQLYCYNVEAILVLFWAAELAQSVYGLTQKYQLERKLRYFNYAAKATAVLLPLVLVASLRAPAVQSNGGVFISLAYLPFWLSVVCESIIMLAILGRYIHTQRMLLRFDPGRAASTDPYSAPGSRRRSRLTRIWCKYIYDRWVMTRFAVAFVRLAIFQVTTAVLQQFAINNSIRDGGPGTVSTMTVPAAPDLSVERARMTMFLFLPGNTPGIALMLIFGTTATFRRHMYKTFVPKRFQSDSSCPMPSLPPHGGPSYPSSDAPKSPPVKAVPYNHTVAAAPISCPQKASLKHVSFQSDSAASSVPSTTQLLRSDSAMSPKRAPRSYRSNSAMSSTSSSRLAPMPLRSNSVTLPRQAPPPVRSNRSMSCSQAGTTPFRPPNGASSRRATLPQPDLMKSLPERPPPCSSSDEEEDIIAIGPGDEVEWEEESATFIMRRIEARHGVQITPGPHRGGLI